MCSLFCLPIHRVHELGDINGAKYKKRTNLNSNSRRTVSYEAHLCHGAANRGKMKTNEAV